MTAKSLILLSILILFVSEISAAKYTKCYVAKLLLSYGIQRSQLENWVCLMESESSYQTNVVVSSEDVGSYVWGPFQIKDKFWCKGSYPYSKNICGVNCKEFLSDNIFKALSCAVKIYNIHGYSAWEGWTIRCKGKHFSLADCGDLSRYVRRH